MNIPIKLKDYTPTQQEVLDFFARISQKLEGRFSFVYKSQSYSPENLRHQMQQGTDLGRALYGYLESLCEFQNREIIDFINNPRMPELFSKVPDIIKIMVKSNGKS